MLDRDNCRKTVKSGRGGGREGEGEKQRKTNVLDKRAGKVSHEFDYGARIPGKWPSGPRQGTSGAKAC